MENNNATQAWLLVRHYSFRILLPLVALLLNGCAACRAYQIFTTSEIAYDQHSSQEHCNFGVVYESRGDLKRARRQYEWAVKKDPSNHLAWFNLGNIHLNAGKLEEARNAYMHALVLRPGYVPAANNLADSYVHSKKINPVLAMQIIDAHMPCNSDIYFKSLVETRNQAIELLLGMDCPVVLISGEFSYTILGYKDFPLHPEVSKLIGSSWFKWKTDREHMESRNTDTQPLVDDAERIRVIVHLGADKSTLAKMFPPNKQNQEDYRYTSLENVVEFLRIHANELEKQETDRPSKLLNAVDMLQKHSQSDLNN